MHVIFYKITGTLKMNIVLKNLQRPSFYINEHSPKRKFILKKFKHFILGSQNGHKGLGQREKNLVSLHFLLLNKLKITFCFRCKLKKSKIK